MMKKIFEPLRDRLSKVNQTQQEIPREYITQDLLGRYIMAPELEDFLRLRFPNIDDWVYEVS